MTSENPLQNSGDGGPSAGSGRPLWTALNLAWELGYTIVIPLVLFALAGRYADKAFGTSPWLLLAGMALAITVTTIALVRKFSKLINDMNKEIPNHVRDDNDKNGR